MAANECSSPQKIRMLKHLLEVVGCDVNSRSYGPYYGSGSMCSIPLCWIACRPKGANVKELIWFLLDHGVDLDLAFEWANPDNDVVVVQVPVKRLKVVHRRENLILFWRKLLKNGRTDAALARQVKRLRRLRVSAYACHVNERARDDFVVNFVGRA
jgi:hypothetical protein